MFSMFSMFIFMIIVCFSYGFSVYGLYNNIKDRYLGSMKGFLIVFTIMVLLTSSVHLYTQIGFSAAWFLIVMGIGSLVFVLLKRKFKYLNFLVIMFICIMLESLSVGIAYFSSAIL